MDNNDFKQLNDETFEEFLYRLYLLKDKYGYTWDEYAPILTESTGTPGTPNAWGKRLRKVSNMFEGTDEYILNSENLLSDEALEVRIERYKLNDQRSQVNNLIRRIAREDTIKEIAQEAALTIGNNYKLKQTKSVTPINRNNEALLLVSDWHYGISIDNIFNKYNIEIARDRIQTLQDETIKRCKEKKITNLSVINLGDLIAGNIHLPLRINSQIDVITQILEVSELYAEMLANLSEHFNVTEYSVLDNHSRIDPKKENSLQLESLARITPWFLTWRLKGCNVTIAENEVDDNIATFNIKDYKIIGVHGDLDKQNKLVESLTTFTQQKYDLIVSAHMHHFSMTESNNTLVVCNGSLMGTDDYAFKLRLNSEPSQTLIILSDKSPCEEIHRIVL